MAPSIRRIVCSCGWTGAVANEPPILCPSCGGAGWRRETNAEALRRLRADAIARGKCSTCRARDVRPGTRFCDECFKRSAEYQARIAYQKCQCCGTELHGRKALLCVTCMAKGTARNRRVVQALVAAGLCGRCGNNPLKPGYKQCVTCLDSEKDRQLALNRSLGMRPRDACSICKRLGIEGRSHNATTHDRWMERRKAWHPKG